MSEYCDEALANLYPYLDRELDTVALERIRLHIEECPPCHGPFFFEERLRVVVSQRLREEVPDDMIERLRRLLASW